VAYYKGVGVNKNAVEAVKWFRLAVEQDHAASKFNLGACYYNGEGVNQDKIEGYKWISLSAAQGHAPAIKTLAVIESEMTPTEIAEAQRLARQFKPRRTLESGEGDLMNSSAR
jgi:TPR repeat protein